jgi:surface antigen
MQSLKILAMASVLAVTSVAVTPLANAQQTQLSQCMRNGLIGAGVGGVIGALTSRHHRLSHAALGAAVGGVGTWGVCKLLSHRDEQNVENAYQHSLSTDRAYDNSWSSDQGRRTVSIAEPEPAPNAGRHCRTMHATISDPQNGRQSLPPETYCRNDEGQWIPQS